jgi:hypothetical protein
MDVVSVLFMKTVFSGTLVKLALFSPMYIFGAFGKNHVDIARWIHILVYFSVALFFIFVLLPVPCFYCYGSVG